MTATAAHTARQYLTGLTAAFADGDSPALDPAQCGTAEFPADFARLVSQWDNCLSAAATINRRYYDDWNNARGALTVIAPAVRESALSELRQVWMSLCRNYIELTLDRDRIVWDCRRCGEHVGVDETIDDDRCPHCYVLLTTDESRTDWL